MISGECGTAVLRSWLDGFIVEGLDYFLLINRLARGTTVII